MNTARVPPPAAVVAVSDEYDKNNHERDRDVARLPVETRVENAPPPPRPPRRGGRTHGAFTRSVCLTLCCWSRGPSLHVRPPDPRARRGFSTNYRREAAPDMTSLKRPETRSLKVSIDPARARSVRCTKKIKYTFTCVYLKEFNQSPERC